MKRTTIGVVDDHFLFRKGFITLLNTCGDLEIVLEAENGKDLLKKIRTSKPEILFVDVRMPLMDGIEATKQIRKKYNDIRIIVLSMCEETELVYSLIESGANGYLTKNSDLDTIQLAIKEVKTKGYYFTPMIASVMARGIVNHKSKAVDFNNPCLSSREIEVVKLICKELTIRQIANVLSISPRTVDTYRENIFQKTGSKNIAGVALYAIRNNLLD